MRAIPLRLLVTAFVAVCLQMDHVRAQGVPDASQLALPTGPVPTDVTPSVFGLQGETQVVVQLIDAPLAVAHGRHAKQIGGRLGTAQQRQYLVRLDQTQDALSAQIRDRGGRELGRLSKALNAVIIAIDASQLPAIAAFPGVRSVRPLHEYKRDLSQTVPYIGASAVHAAGFDGTSIRVAVLDTGIDYTHKFLGGPGTAAAFTAAYGTTTTDARTTTTDGLFPTPKVVGGFDFVGEKWPGAPGAPQPLEPDPDPIDCGPSVIPLPCDGGHGTHVADIIAGNDGASHKGVAPGASLYAVKVCSTVSTACSGLALLQGMDFALDPNGDADISDAVDVINMSLGSSYGQIQDDLTEATSIASELGVVVVAAAGNDADRPYIVSSPSVAPEAISVAQTQVPSSAQDFMTVVSPPAIARDYPAVFQPWSAPLTVLIQAPVQYGNGAGGNLNGCAAFAAGSLAGKIVLVDRGTCFFSDKIRNIANGGGLVGVIGLIAPGEPFAGAFGGGPPITIPGFMISQATSNTIKGQLPAGVIAKFDPNARLPLVMSMVSSSARGPSYSLNSIKPDIGAPGASVSAEAGTGTGQTAFSGTSGATPMISGSAALLIQAHPAYDPLQIKALLMNTAETNIQINPGLQPGVLAPITRIGSGEVRVDRAAASTTVAWDADDLTPSISFGYNALNESKTFNRRVEVRNYGSKGRTYSIGTGFRYASDAASGAVAISTPSSVTVRAHGTATFKVQLKTDVTKLPIWTLNGGSRGGDGFRLQDVEFDGFITLTDGTDTVHLPWHILPHRAADVTLSSTGVTLNNGMANVVLSNVTGAVPGRVDVFSLTGTSPRIPPPRLPGPGDAFAVIDMKSVGVRLFPNLQTGPFIQFAINTFGARSHPNYPAEFDIYVDANRDGDPDSVVFNLENGGFAATGQNIVAVYSFATNRATLFSFTDADLNSANAILTAPLSALGLSADTRFDFSVFAFDNYFTGNLTDAIEGMTYTPSTPRFVTSGVPTGGVPVGGTSTLTIQMVPGGDAASPSQRGILLMYRDGTSKHEADTIAVTP
jgi:subtilisin family serine protease